MQTKKQNTYDVEKHLYLTQRELAKRWRVSESTIKKLRDDGNLPFFQPPGSNRILYPFGEIELLEVNNSGNIKKEEKTPSRPTEILRKKPVNSSSSKNEWRI